MPTVDRPILRHWVKGWWKTQTARPVTNSARRIRRLEEDGFIEGYRAQLNRDKLDLGITIFVHVRLNQHQDTLVDAFEATVRKMAEVINCHTVSGAFDYLLHVVTRDLSGYEQWVRRLQKLPNVNTLDSSFAIRSVKEQAPLPIGL